MRLIDNTQLRRLYAEASASERKRSHLLLHDSHQDKVQRLIIAMVKGSYVEPHYHELDTQWEMFTVLQGVIKVTVYSPKGEVLHSYKAGPEEEVAIIEFAPGDIHSVECLSANSVMIEVKEGPFNPDFAKAYPQW